MIDVIYEEDDFLVVNKPSGISSQGDKAEPGILSLLKERMGYERVYPVHRLDKPTSGVLLVAKTEGACSELSQLFQQKKVSKHYIAVSPKKPNKKMGSVIGDMEKSRNGAWKLLRGTLNPAVTQFTSFGLGVSPVSNRSHRMFILKPHTGKTHQIRAALKSLGAPILGDAQYSGLKSDRVYLHAWSIAFPFQGKVFQCLAPPESGDEFCTPSVVEKLQEMGSPFQLSWPELPKKYR